MGERDEIIRLPRLTLEEAFERYQISGLVDGDRDWPAWEAAAAEEVMSGYDERPTEGARSGLARAAGMSGTELERGKYRTELVEGVWYSLGPSVLPPDDRPGWVDLHRHQEEGTVVLGRFQGAAAAIAWARERFGVAPAGWQRDDGDG